MKPDDTERRDAVVKVCELYYVRGLNHQSIAEELGFSRWKVSRLLEVGRTEGFVQVRVYDPYSRDADLEAELLHRYSLEEFGLREGEVHERFGEYVRAFAIPRENSGDAFAPRRAKHA